MRRRTGQSESSDHPAKNQDQRMVNTHVFPCFPCCYIARAFRSLSCVEWIKWVSTGNDVPENTRKTSIIAVR